MQKPTTGRGGRYLGEVVLDLLLQLGNLVPVPLGQDLDVGDADGVVERGHGGRVALPLERQIDCVLQRGQHTQYEAIIAMIFLPLGPTCVAS